MADSATAGPGGHFYSAIVSRSEAAEEWERLSRARAPSCIDLGIARQRDVWDRLDDSFRTMPFPDEPTPGVRYHFNNPSYAFGDASVYWGKLTLLRPRRLIEIGSGFSSALALELVEALCLPTACTFIDPYPALAEQVTAP